MPPALPDDPAPDAPLELNWARDVDEHGTRLAPIADLDRYFFEYLGSSPEIGNQSFEPWFVTMCADGVCVAPARLDPEMQWRRHRLITDWKLPSYPSSPAGLLRFGRDDSVVFRHMAADGRVLVPLFHFEGAMRFAHLGVRSTHESYSRSGEFRQMQHRISMWPGDENGIFFLGIRKLGDVSDVTDGDRTLDPGHDLVAPEHRHMDPFRVSESLHNEAFDLAEFVIDFCHKEIGELPDMPPPPAFRHKCTAGPYIFSWAGRCRSSLGVVGPWRPTTRCWRCGMPRVRSPDWSTASSPRGSGVPTHAASRTSTPCSCTRCRSAPWRR